ncbi:MAG: isoprenyl transferase [Lentisphaeria bacterium]|nr:isoprenyl transferase [Lentisphaeria bacterium]
MTESTINPPKHVAIIMDGNGRWAEKRGSKRISGHRAGAKTVERIIKASGKLGIKHITLYAFSIENWSRPQDEIDALMILLEKFLMNNLKVLKKENLRLTAIGSLEMLPESTRSILNEVMEDTKHNTNGTLNLALSYGSRTEIVDATKKIAQAVLDGELNVEDIDQNLISASLYTAGLPDPDLVIRTSGEVRLSNFLLWQLSYAELFFTDTLWPDFSDQEYEQIITNFSRRDRRFGGIKNA